MIDRRIGYEEAATTPSDALLSALESVTGGLSETEAKARMEEYGPNHVTVSPVTWRTVLVRQFRSPFIFLLIAAAAVAFFTDQLLDAVLICSFVVINVSLTFFQEFRAEQSARLLRRFWNNEATVVRGGKRRTVRSDDLVPGDVVHLRAGDKIPADVRFLDARNLLVDESVLTGESVAVRKVADAMDLAPKGAHAALNVGFSGTSVQTGEAEAVVFSTGAQSTLGSIVKLTGQTTTTGKFERDIANFSGFILKLVGITLVVVFLLNIGIKGLGDIEQLFLFAVALTIGVIPEALPVVMTVTHTRAALRMASRQVIVKRLSAIDDLGSIDVLCTDKTGTVTKNELAVAAVIADDRQACLRAALLGSAPSGGGRRSVENPFDRALWDAADEALREEARTWERLSELPFDPVRRVNTMMVRSGSATFMVTRGAPENVLSMCTDRADRLELGKRIEREGRIGRRVIAVASRTAEDGHLAPEDECGMDFLGLIAFEDPLKHGSLAAVQKAGKLGVRVVMLTGDAREVAAAVGEKLGLTADDAGVMTGAELDALPADRQAEAVSKVNVFARVDPVQKFRILGLLKQRGLAVGFLGEGFNDAPGLKMADVAIAVENASDVAKDAADVILVSKSLSSIMEGIEIGRRNFANIIKYLTITLASNFGNFYSVAIASLLVPYLPMLPVQILLLNLLTDAPLIAVAADAVAVEDLKQPSKYSARDIILSSTVFGVVSSAFDFLTFAVFSRSGEGALQTMWFIESALTELVLIYSIRTSKFFVRGPAVPRGMAMLTTGVIGLVLALPFLPFGRSLFGFIVPRPAHMAGVFVLIVLYFVTTEAVKLRIRGKRNGAAAHGAT